MFHFSCWVEQYQLDNIFVVPILVVLCVIDFFVMCEYTVYKCQLLITGERFIIDIYNCRYKIASKK